MRYHRPPVKNNALCIVGLGLMGASLAMALRERHGNKYGPILGVARSQETVRKALARHIVDEASSDLGAMLKHPAMQTGGIVIMCTPVRTVVDHLSQYRDVFAPGTIITDMGSTKGEICNAMDGLPDHIFAIGSHPMCGKETAGIDVAEGNLYINRPWILSRTCRTDEATYAAVQQLAQDAGAITLEIAPQRHDAVLAISSHLPYALALSLMTTADQASLNESMIYPVMAGGFRDTSRVAASDVTMWVDILLSNGHAVSNTIRDFQFNLDQLTALIERQDADGLRAFISAAAEARRNKVKVK
ncbi:MAG: prephenate dehydrogenase/arogenate dehydrogenase family protein [Chloroflexota bacterium]|jgi:prephenate dehydrogenase|nr:prephenate dehydrogenase/arogenate dehydrogenase family protein [Chloroflexota bacterium]